jgi:hypothetical protein
MKLRIAAIALAIAIIVALGIWAGVSPGTEREIGCYATERLRRYTILP